MEFDVILQAIGSVGFPIVMCLVVYLNGNKMLEKVTQAIEKFSSEMEKMNDRLADIERKVDK